METNPVFADVMLETHSFFALLNKIYQAERENLFPPPPWERPSAQSSQSASGYPTIQTDNATRWFEIPTAPPGVDVDENIRRAQASLSLRWFIDKVRPDGEMDYKTYAKNPRVYEDFGNFNYGAVALGFGFSEETALRAAGFVQALSNTGRAIEKKDPGRILDAALHLPDCLGGPPYGDEEKDQEMIKLGFRYYKEVFAPQNPIGERHDDYKRILGGISSETLYRYNQ